MYTCARYYDSATGEFLSPDPLEFVDGMSLYRGCFAPNSADPLGLSNWYGYKGYQRRWPKPAAAYVNAVKSGEASYGVYSDFASLAGTRPWEYWFSTTGSRIYDVKLWNSLPGKLLRHYYGNSGETFTLSSDEMKRLVKDTVFGRHAVNAAFIAQKQVIPILKTSPFAGAAMKKWNYDRMGGSYDLAFGGFWSVFSGVAAKRCVKPAGTHFGIGIPVCTMFLEMRIHDYYDFDIHSTDYLGGWFGLELASDNDLAWFHLYGLMQAFKVEGKAKINFDFDCNSGTWLNRGEIIELMER